jgi:hypothetical protein
MDIQVGDRVQIVDGGIDVTNGNRATANRFYGEGGPLWGTVELIDENWKTGSRWGLPATVVKVRIKADNDVIVWQVQPEHVAGQKLRMTETSVEPPALPKVETATEALTKAEATEREATPPPTRPYTTGVGSENWAKGI